MTLGHFAMLLLGLAVATVYTTIRTYNTAERAGQRIGEKVAKDILPRSILPTLYVIEAAISRRKITPEAVVAECIAYWEEHISDEEVAHVREKWIGGPS